MAGVAGSNPASSTSFLQGIRIAAIAPVSKTGEATPHRFESCIPCHIQQYQHHRGVAQPGRALGLGPSGRTFEPCRPDQFRRGLVRCLQRTSHLLQVSAQLPGFAPRTERLLSEVPSPSEVVDQYGDLAQMGEQRLCKAMVVGSIPTFSTKHNAGIAQLVERHVANVKVAGSSPATRSSSNQAQTIERRRSL